ncbi:MAG: tRNA threonylcarbamoyladenosine dehydratase [Lachnospiraceae bacterium]|nr:tRNA threonylcarbamoyladenosine dehydratase [Lachnospiraceae bacterium]
MEEMFSRTAMLLGEESLEKLAKARVAVFGVGGVGGYVVEALVRAGVGAIAIVDNDTVCESNLNRQIIATRSALGQYKVDVMEARIKDINPSCQVEKYKCFYLPETAEEFDFKRYSYVVDAIDTVTGKIQLVLQAGEAGVPIISSMGTGNKLNPMELEIADIYKTSVCPLAKVMRRELKQRGVKSLKVLFSKEEPRKPCLQPETDTGDSPRRATPGSVSFVPSVAGLIIASEVVKDLIAG